MKKLFFAGILLMLLLNACVQAQTVNPDKFENGLKDKDAQLLDVRTPEEYVEGHISHALLADIKNESNFNAKTDALDKNKPVYVYCRSGHRSHKAAGLLKKKGFKNVVELDGGIEAWRENGKKITLTDTE